MSDGINLSLGEAIGIYAEGAKLAEKVEFLQFENTLLKQTIEQCKRQIIDMYRWPIDKQQVRKWWVANKLGADTPTCELLGEEG
jgi:hypothetical protein